MKLTSVKNGDALQNQLTPYSYITFENILMNWCSENVTPYNGGMWVLAHPNDDDDIVFWYLRGDEDDTFTIINPGAHWQGEVSRQTMGLIATLVGLNHALWYFYHRDVGISQRFSEAYQKLLNWAYTTDDAGVISMALD